MKNLLLCLLLVVSLKSLSQQAYLNFANGIQYFSNHCSTGPYEGKLQSGVSVYNIDTNTVYNYTFTIKVDGNIVYSRDSSFLTYTFSWYSFSVEAQNITIQDPGIHVIQASIEIWEDPQGTIFGDSITETKELGPNSCTERTIKAFVDKNADCKYQATDSLLAFHSFFRSDSGYFNQEFFTDINGERTFLLPKDYYLSITSPSLAYLGEGQGYARICGNTWIYVDTNVTEIAYDTSHFYPDYSNISFIQQRFGPNCAPSFVYFSLEGIGYPFPNYDLEYKFGDGSNLTRNNIDSVIPTERAYYQSGSYHTAAILSLPDTTITLTGNISIADTCGNIGGRLFHDKNANCTYDEGVDELLSRVGVQISTSGTFQYYTGDSGEYSFEVPIDTPYTIKPLGLRDSILEKHYLKACTTELKDSTIRQDLDFAFYCDKTSADMQVGVYGGPYRPGTNRYINFRAENLSCISASGTLRLRIDTLTQFISASITPNRINGNILEWDFSSIKGMDRFFCQIELSVSTNAKIGDYICHTLESINANEENPENNLFIGCGEVRTSYDPNDKTAYINSGQKEGNKLIHDDHILYRIRFQNTGNDTAFNIFINDTIDPNLDLSSLQVLESSHPMSFYIGGSRNIRFQFDNIMLPDSNTNEPLSHGYVYFKIRPSAEAPLGTELTNQVGIYFDYNDPVLTNTTLNTLFECTVQASVEPLRICEGDQKIGLINGVPNGGQYFGEGIENNEFDPAKLSVGTYYFKYVYVDNDSCFASAIGQITLNNCTGLNPNQGHSDLYLQPNPSNEYFEIIGLNLGDKYEIVDLSGRIHVNAISNGGKDLVYTKNWAGGIYTVKVLRGSLMKTYRLVVY